MLQLQRPIISMAIRESIEPLLVPARHVISTSTSNRIVCHHVRAEGTHCGGVE